MTSEAKASAGSIALTTTGWVNVAAARAALRLIKECRAPHSPQTTSETP